MNMTIGYLLKNREKSIFISSRWFILWIKRLITARGLMSILWSAWYCKFRGGKVGKLTVIEGTSLKGKIVNLKIGESSFIARSANITLHACVTIGSRVVINDGVQILTASHAINSPSWNTYSKPIQIADYAWIATNAIILPGVSIGRGAIVGAGSVVRSDVPDGVVVAGNPAVKVAVRCDELIYSPVELCAPYEAWLGSKICL